MANLKNTQIADTGFIDLPNGTTANRPNTPQQGMIRYNTDIGNTEYYDGTNWKSKDEKPKLTVSGSVETLERQGHIIHIFTGAGSVEVVNTAEIEYLIVAGGGGSNDAEGSPAGDGAGGGGGGGFLTGIVVPNNGSYAVTVGAGGNKSPGEDSEIFGLTAIGGGRGGGRRNAGTTSGGSGGGAGGTCLDVGDRLGGNGTPGQGNRGGNDLSPSSSCSARGGMGGGGAGTQGLDADSQNGVDGGAGLPCGITGEIRYYAGGGGGGRGSDRTEAGQGGLGGGGDGSNGAYKARDGLPNTGGGAGGGGSGDIVGGIGGSGIVVIRYKK